MRPQIANPCDKSPRIPKTFIESKSCIIGYAGGRDDRGRRVALQKVESRT